ncbi:unnamed protein product [Linum trigynum]|uniref:Cystatin domain-containing protein n=1 Tax=Linum trigynum TaxID=586398 RepID=A0AAV2C9A7_9ROSI
MDTQPLPLESTPGPETGLESEPEKQKREEAGGSNDDKVADGSGEGDEGEDDEDFEIEIVEEEDDGTERQVFVQAPSKPLIWYPKDKAGLEKLQNFYDTILKSEGFDVGEELPPVDIIEFGVLPVNLKSKWHGENVKACVEFVIEQYNKEREGKSELKVVDIVKANWGQCSGKNYYITLEAADLLSSDPAATKTYEAEVYRNIRGKLSTTLFRVKGQTETILEMEGGRPRTCM